jgi:hypothetical protein
MRAFRRLGIFVWDFVIGDDWRVAVGVVAALGVAAALAAAGIAAWWFVPLAVTALLALSLYREIRVQQR